MDPMVFDQDPAVVLDALPEITSGFSSPLTPLTPSSRAGSPGFASVPVPEVSASVPALCIIPIIPITESAPVTGLGIASSAVHTASPESEINPNSPNSPAGTPAIPCLVVSTTTATSTVNCQSDSSLDTDSSDDDAPSALTITSHIKMSAGVTYCDLTVSKGHSKPPSLGHGWLG
ncbi:hypothetical protein H1R20_g14000, partial [Candolleomyces eurysporus]